MIFSFPTTPATRRRSLMSWILESSLAAAFTARYCRCHRCGFRKPPCFSYGHHRPSLDQSISFSRFWWSRGRRPSPGSGRRPVQRRCSTSWLGRAAHGEGRGGLM
jgi:hypothetical protein